MSLPEESRRRESHAFDERKRSRKKSDAQEKRVASKIGGRRQPGSGNKNTVKRGGVGMTKGSLLDRNRGSFAPGDVNHDAFLIEAKRTDAKSISIKAEWLIKIDTEATMLGKLPALSIELGGLPKMVEQDWCLIPMPVFKALVDRKGQTE